MTEVAVRFPSPDEVVLRYPGAYAETLRRARADPRMAWALEVEPRFLRALTESNGPLAAPELTLGPQWCRWIETNCVFGEGDAYGRAVRLQPWQRALFWKLAEILDTGRRRYSFALISLGKGSGKSPVGGWLGAVDLAGPSVTCSGEVKGKPCEKCSGGWRPDGTPHAVRRSSPDVLNMASSYEQADLILDEMRVTFDEGPLSEHARTMKGVIELKGARGRARRIPATPKKADGSKATTLLADEVHEMTSQRQETAYDVASGGTAKRQDGLVVMLSTAGFDYATMFGREVARGLRGEYADHELFLYLRADATLDATDDADVAEGIRQANPLAAAGIANVAKLVAKFRGMPLFRAKRYYWNQWTNSDESWLPAGAWDACKGELIIDTSLPTWVGADMALKRDSAAIVVLQRRPDGKLQAFARIWFPNGAVIDQGECDEYLRTICATYNVHWVAADEAWWPTLGALEKGDEENDQPPLPIFRMPQLGRNMVIAYSETYRVIVDQVLVHAGAPDFADQVTSAAPHSGDGGWRLRKGRNKRRIDSAPALAGAVFATTVEPEAKPAPPQAPAVVLPSRLRRNREG